jgi:hypothetical protein
VRIAFAAATPIVTVTGGSVSAGAGAETPSVIAVGGFLYCIYNDQPIPGSLSHNPGLAIARAPLSTDGAPGSWLKLSGGQFSSNALNNGAFDDISPTPPRGSGDDGSPNVTFNKYLNAFTLLLVGGDGIYMSTSSDLIHWSSGIKIINAPGPSNAYVGSVIATALESGASVPAYAWYPSMVSPGENSNQVTDQTGYIYMAYSPGGVGISEQMYRYPYAIGNAALPSARERRH